MRYIIGSADWSAVGIVGTLCVSFIGAVFGLVQARKADKSASTSKTIELGVRDLIDQYQERLRELKEDIDECSARCLQLEADLGEARSSLHNARMEIAELRSGDVP